jgi:hypothetical protein
MFLPLINVHPLHGIHFKTFLVFTLQKGTSFFFSFLSSWLYVPFRVIANSPSSLSNVHLIQGLRFVATQSSSSFPIIQCFCIIIICSSYSRFRIYCNGEFIFFFLLLKVFENIFKLYIKHAKNMPLFHCILRNIRLLQVFSKIYKGWPPQGNCQWGLGISCYSMLGFVFYIHNLIISKSTCLSLITIII